MVTAARLSDRLYATGQIVPEDVGSLAEQGFTAVINNRPDGEGGPQQPSSAALATAAAAAGIGYHYLPLGADGLSPELIAGFYDALSDAEGPVLAFCKTGMRSAVLWALTEVCHLERPVDVVLSEAVDGGYDLSGMRPLFERVVALKPGT
jgi:sulfide:quinone oxidoreductase